MIWQRRKYGLLANKSYFLDSNLHQRREPHEHMPDLICLGLVHDENLDYPNSYSKYLIITYSVLL